MTVAEITRKTANVDIAAVIAAGVAVRRLRMFLFVLSIIGLYPFLTFQVWALWGLCAIIGHAIFLSVEAKFAAQDGPGWRSYCLAFVASAAVWVVGPVYAWALGRTGAYLIDSVFACLILFQIFDYFRSSARWAVLAAAPIMVASVIFLVLSFGTARFWPTACAIIAVVVSFYARVQVNRARSEKRSAYESDQSLLIADLERARDKAEAADRAKSALLALLSHELRTPMNSMLGAAQLLEGGSLSEGQKEFVSVILNSGAIITDILNNVSDLTKIESDRLDLDQSEVDPVELLERCAASYDESLRERDLSYALEIVGDTPKTIVGDPKRLMQIFEVLIKNAIRFSAQGCLTVRFSAHKISARRAQLNFAFKDTGAGLDDRALRAMWQPLEEASDLSTLRDGDVVLSMSIIRRLASLMGGELNVDSMSGEGVTVTFSMDATVTAWMADEVTENAAPEAEAERGLRVLLVEDHPVNRMIVESWLMSVGHTVTSAENGAIAVELCAAAAYDVILMDVNMPVMDGLAACREIRSKAGPNQDVAIVILSASTRSEDHEAGVVAGADAYLAKPIDFRALVAMLGAARDGRQALRTAA